MTMASWMAVRFSLEVSGGRDGVKTINGQKLYDTIEFPVLCTCYLLILTLSMLKEMRLSVDPWMFLLKIDARTHEILKADLANSPLNAHCCRPILKG
jgi:hypothetical protein